MKDQYPLSLKNLSNSLNKEIGQDIERIKALFLIRFTKELLKNSGTGYLFELERLNKEKFLKAKRKVIIKRNFANN